MINSFVKGMCRTITIIAILLILINPIVILLLQTIHKIIAVILIRREVISEKRLQRRIKLINSITVILTVKTMSLNMMLDTQLQRVDI